MLSRCWTGTPIKATTRLIFIKNIGTCILFLVQLTSGGWSRFRFHCAKVRYRASALNRLLSLATARTWKLHGIRPMWIPSVSARTIQLLKACYPSLTKWCPGLALGISIRVIAKVLILFLLYELTFAFVSFTFSSNDCQEELTTIAFVNVTLHQLTPRRAYHFILDSTRQALARPVWSTRVPPIYPFVWHEFVQPLLPYKTHFTRLLTQTTFFSNHFYWLYSRSILLGVELNCT